MFVNKNVSVNLFFERIYSNIYIPKEQSAKDEIKNVRAVEKPVGFEALSN